MDNFLRITFIFQGLRVSNYWVRISRVLFLLAVCYCLIQLNFDLNILLVRVKAFLLGKSFHFLFSRLGWWTGGLFLATLFFLFDSETGSWGTTMAPSGASGASSSSARDEDSFGIRVLLEPFSETEPESTSVNQPEERPAPPANPVASPGEEAGPSNRTPPVVPYPYQEDEILGGIAFYPSNVAFWRTTLLPLPRSYKWLVFKPKIFSRSRLRLSNKWQTLIQREIGWGGELGPSIIRIPPRGKSPWKSSMPFRRSKRGAEYDPLPFYPCKARYQGKVFFRYRY